MANTFLAGNLTADPEHRSSENGKPFCLFTVAINQRRHVDGRWEDGPTSFHRCIVWADQAERVASELHKGDRVVLVGEVTTHSYKDESGKPHTATTIRVEEVGPSLRFDDAAEHHEAHGEEAY